MTLIGRPLFSPCSNARAARSSLILKYIFEVRGKRSGSSAWYLSASFVSRMAASMRGTSAAGPARKPQLSDGYCSRACASTSASTARGMIRSPRIQPGSPLIVLLPAHRGEVPVAAIAGDGDHASLADPLGHLHRRPDVG